MKETVGQRSPRKSLAIRRMHLNINIRPLILRDCILASFYKTQVWTGNFWTWTRLISSGVTLNEADKILIVFSVDTALSMLDWTGKLTPISLDVNIESHYFKPNVYINLWILTNRIDQLFDGFFVGKVAHAPCLILILMKIISMKMLRIIPKLCGLTNLTNRISVTA